jgi:hypothetical protein
MMQSSDADLIIKQRIMGLLGDTAMEGRCTALASVIGLYTA